MTGISYFCDSFQIYTSHHVQTTVCTASAGQGCSHVQDDGALLLQSVCLQYA